MTTPLSLVVLDLEATCWPVNSYPDRMETIEIGAVRLTGSPLQASDEFQAFIRPVAEPVLSAFCMELTKITQADVDAAPPFPDALQRFLAWIGPHDTRLASWGDYDRRQLERDCARHGLPPPDVLRGHLNLKRMFAEKYACRPCGMRNALGRLGLEHAGTHHRGIDDARNIARIAAVVLADDPGPPLG